MYDTYITDRSESARLLLEIDEPAPAGVEDDSGQSAISWMITKMPPVVSNLPPQPPQPPQPPPPTRIGCSCYL